MIDAPMRTAGLIVGMILLVMGAQGAIRLMADHDDAGPLGWMPGGFAAQLSVYCLTVVVGTTIASHFTARPDETSTDHHRCAHSKAGPPAPCPPPIRVEPPGARRRGSGRCSPGCRGRAPHAADLSSGCPQREHSATFTAPTMAGGRACAPCMFRAGRARICRGRARRSSPTQLGVRRRRRGSCDDGSGSTCDGLAGRRTDPLAPAARVSSSRCRPTGCDTSASHLSRSVVHRGALRR